MIKLLIVDDERFIRETIASIIDWNSLGVEVIGQAADGVEAYNIILDEYPDIVMTDIKMPGLSGLELIQKIYNTNKDTAFIILSGYDDFEYAKEAMKYGIRHYLLKPCNAQQIISCIRETIEELTKKNRLGKSRSLSLQLNSDIFLSIFNQCISSGSSFEDCSLYHSFEKYLDFKSTPYELCYLFYLESSNLSCALDTIEQYRKTVCPGVAFHYIYVRNTLTVFFTSLLSDYDGFDGFLSTLSFPRQSVAPP